MEPSLPSTSRDLAFQGVDGGLTPHQRGVVPTVKIIGPYRFHFYSSDRDEPVHVHVERDAATAKFWLNPVRLERSQRFTRTELARLQELVERHQPEFRKKWNDYFGTE